MSNFSDANHGFFRDVGSVRYSEAAAKQAWDFLSEIPCDSTLRPETAQLNCMVRSRRDRNHAAFIERGRNFRAIQSDSFQNWPAIHKNDSRSRTGSKARTCARYYR